MKNYLIIAIINVFSCFTITGTIHKVSEQDYRYAIQKRFPQKKAFSYKSAQQSDNVPLRDSKPFYFLDYDDKCDVIGAACAIAECDTTGNNSTITLREFYYDNHDGIIFLFCNAARVTAEAYFPHDTFKLVINTIDAVESRESSEQEKDISEK
jgi:hypothetical protein